MIESVVSKFHEIFPRKEGLTDWDNIGLLIHSPIFNKNILLTIDATNEVINECIKLNCQTIISYHPIIFDGLKSIDYTQSVYKCINNNISVFSPHTCLDKEMNLYILKSLANIFNQTLEFEFNVLACIGKLDVKVKDVFNELKKLLKCSNLRICFDDESFKPEKICVGVGEGYNKIDVNNSLIITGEMKHHTLLEAKRRNNVVILTEHSNGERFFLEELKRKLTCAMPEFNFLISKTDKDPIKFLISDDSMVL